MNNKSFFKSKINWAAIILILQALLPVFENQNFENMTFQNWFTFVLGIIIIILRTYFTSQPIKSK